MKLNLKIINVEVWKSVSDGQYRIIVFFWKWEVARFKILTKLGTSPISKVERVKEGNY
jgi:hypothetical protein